MEAYLNCRSCHELLPYGSVLVRCRGMGSVSSANEGHARRGYGCDPRGRPCEAYQGPRSPTVAQGKLPHHDEEVGSPYWGAVSSSTATPRARSKSTTAK